MGAPRGIISWRPDGTVLRAIEYFNAADVF